MVKFNKASAEVKPKSWSTSDSCVIVTCPVVTAVSVSVALAVPEFPRLEVKALLVLTTGPVPVAVTFTATVQLPPATRLPADKLTRLLPLGANNVPPHVELILGVAAT